MASKKSKKKGVQAEPVRKRVPRDFLVLHAIGFAVRELRRIASAHRYEPPKDEPIVGEPAARMACEAMEVLIEMADAKYGRGVLSSALKNAL